MTHKIRNVNPGTHEWFDVSYFSFNCDSNPRQPALFRMQRDIFIPVNTQDHSHQKVRHQCSTTSN